jgi:hypothetical protein
LSRDSHSVSKVYAFHYGPELLAKATRVQFIIDGPSFSPVEIRLNHLHCNKIVSVLKSMFMDFIGKTICNVVFIKVSYCKLQCTINSKIFFLRLIVVTLNSNVDIYKFKFIYIPRTLHIVSVNPPGFMDFFVFFGGLHLCTVRIDRWVYIVLAYMLLVLV